MKIDNRHINTIKRVFAAGYGDEKAIASLSTKQILDISGSLAEVSAVVEFQEAIKNGKLLSYILKEGSQNQ